MLKFSTKILAVLLVVAGIVFFNGCQEQQSVNSPEPGSSSLSKVTTFTMPAGATLVSASLELYAWSWDGDPHNIDIHKITSDWSCPVTWNSFAGAFDPTVITSFNTSNEGGGPIWKSVDITSTFEGWLSGETNYGLLLKNQDILQGLAKWLSNEYPDMTLRPYLKVVTSAGIIEVEPALDTYINSISPDNSYCTEEQLFCGTAVVSGVSEYKHTLIRFNVEPQNEVCETAYAFGGTIATCFLNLSPISGNNWGWTNLISPGNSYQWPLYAGAAGCDVTKGTLVGHVDVSYLAGTITVDYVLDSGFNLAETHVWIGTTPLPVKNGVYQTSPGKFNYNGMDPVVLTGQTGNKYVAVHAGVCWFE